MKVLAKERYQVFKIFCFKPLFNLTCLTVSLSLASTASQAEIVLSGEIKQGGLVIGKTKADNQVLFDGKVLSLSPEGDYVFGFGRDDVETHQLVIKYPDGKQEQKTILPAKRSYNIQRIEGIPKRIMEPDPAAVKRSKQDNLQIASARKTSSMLTSFAGGFIAPINGKVTGVYGSQRVFNGKPKRPHFGLDYAGKTGDPVKAPAAGKVLLFVADMFYSGGTMIIDHGQGVTSTFLHLSKSYVKEGDVVKKGQKIAAVGSSGRATGPHLDWRINWFNTRIDPAFVLKIKPLK